MVHVVVGVACTLAYQIRKSNIVALSHGAEEAGHGILGHGIIGHGILGHVIK